MKSIVHCDAEEGGMWYSRNPQYKECMTDPELIELVKRKDEIEIRFLHLPRGSERRLDAEQQFNDIVQEIRILAYQKWPDGNWSDAVYLTHTSYPEGSHVLISSEYGIEHVVLLEPNYTIIEL